MQKKFASSTCSRRPLSRESAIRVLERVGEWPKPEGLRPPAPPAKGLPALWMPGKGTALDLRPEEPGGTLAHVLAVTAMAAAPRRSVHSEFLPPECADGQSHRFRQATPDRTPPDPPASRPQSAPRPEAKRFPRAI